MPRVKIETKGLDELRRGLLLIEEDSEEICKRSIFDGAAQAAAALKAAVGTLHTVPDVVAMGNWRKMQPGYLSVKQKLGLLSGLGIARMKTRGQEINAKVGFGGYNDVKTKRWPNGQPNVMIAAQCNHGNSSTMLRQPFIDAAVEVSQGDIEAAMRATLTAELTKRLES